MSSIRLLKNIFLLSVMIHSSRGIEREAFVRKILEHYVAKEGKDQEFCDVTKIKLVLAPYF
jgi:hypothetical protein